MAAPPGWALADLLLGRITSVEHGGQQNLPGARLIWVLRAGHLAGDGRVTVNLGLRWEPYLGTSVESGAVYNFNTRQVPPRRQEHRVRERARGHALSRRRGISVRTDRAEQAVDELLAEGWRGVGPDR